VGADSPERKQLCKSGSLARQPLLDRREEALVPEEVVELAFEVTRSYHFLICMYAACMNAPSAGFTSLRFDVKLLILQALF
jgi:hypothetical protein